MRNAPGPTLTLDDNYRSIFENASIGLYRSTPDGRLVRANPALVRLNGYPDEAALLESLESGGNQWYVEPGRRAEFHRLIAERDRIQGFVSEVYRTGTGERIWVSEDAWTVRDDAGTVVFYEGTVQEVTDRIATDQRLSQARREAEAASEAKSTFLAVMSHELRSPLNAIIGFAEIIAGRLLGPEDPRYFEYAEDIRISGTHLLDLISDILDLSKIGAGKMHLDEERVDLADLAGRTARLFTANLSTANLNLVIAVPKGFPTLRADPMRLGQILVNLVSNSIKFTPPGGTITIDAAERPGTLQIRVTDTGSGMTPEEATKALEPFVQISHPVNKSRGGTGLGLSICRELAALHDGTLTIESVKGAGTTVTIHLPRTRAITERTQTV